MTSEKKKRSITPPSVGQARVRVAAVKVIVAVLRPFDKATRKRLLSIAGHDPKVSDD